MIDILVIVWIVAIFTVPAYLNYRRNTIRYQEAKELAKPYETE